jgi:DNA polymerase-1
MALSGASRRKQTPSSFNLGLINGQLPAGMVTSAKERFDLVVSEDEARRYREKFLEIYPKIRERNTTCWHSATKGVDEVRTRTGRRRLIADNATEGERLRLLLNTPIQGGTADGMKKAMILLHQRLESVSPD